MVSKNRLIWFDDVVANMCKRCNEEYPNEPCEPAYCFMREGLERCETADAVPVADIEAWLYQIAMNNTGNPLCAACEEIISRLDGLRKFSRERGDGK